MRTIKNFDSEKRMLIYTAVSTNGGQSVMTSSLTMMEDVYTKFSIEVNVKEKSVKIAEKDCIADIILSEDEYSFVQRCLKSEKTPWDNYPMAKMSQIITEDFSKIEFKDDPPKPDKEKEK